jgi:hypothetical protein
MPECTVRVNPHVQDAENHARVWMNRYGLTGTETQRHMIHASFIGKAIAWNFPDADLDSLYQATEIFAWALGFDDTRAETVSQAEFAQLMNEIPRLMGALGGIVSDHTSTGFVAALTDLVRGFNRWPPQQILRILDAIRATLTGLVWEAHIRSTGAHPSVDDYLVMRPYFFYSYILIALAEPIGRYTLPDDLRHSPDVQRLETAVANLIAWQNDLVSFHLETELFGPTPLSLPGLLAIHQGCDYREAFSRVYSMYEEETRQAIQLINRCRASGTPQLRYHADAMTKMITGCYVWHTNIAKHRYGNADT